MAFILGCYNSGTTLLHSLLGAHPAVCTLPREGVRLTDVWPTPEDLGWNRMWVRCEEYVREPTVDPKQAATAALRHFRPWWNRSTPLGLEKSIANLPRFAWLASGFPDARFIGIIRNGYYVAESIVRKASPAKQARKTIKRYSLEDGMKQWLAAAEALDQASRHLGRFHLVSYEDLINDPVTHLKQIFSFLGISAPPIRHEGDQLAVADQAFQLRDGNRRPLPVLSQREMQFAVEHMAPLMRRFGYEGLPA